MLLGFALAAIPAVGVTVVVALMGRALYRVVHIPKADAATAVLADHPGKARGPVRRGPLTVGWVGDMTPGTRTAGAASDAIFAGVRRSLAAPDVMLGNLEGTIGTGGTPKCGEGVPNCFAFQAPPAAAGLLRRAGFDGVNLANNHANDYGAEGRYETVAALSRAGVASAGMPAYVRLLHARGRTIAVVGFASYDWSSPLNDPAAVRDIVGEASRESDVVVVLFHGGAEGSDRTHVPRGTEYAFGENRGDLRAFAHTAIDAGGDLVLGSGPHVLRGLERYHDRLIAYSLGNFAGVGNFATEGVLALSGVLEVRLGADGSFRGGRLRSVTLTGEGTPAPDATNAAAHLVAGLSREDFGAGAVAVADDGTLRP
jgi:hypothetical protein